MATKKQIADLNASVTLYAKQYIDEMVRVGKVTQNASGTINKSMATAAKSTKLLNASQVAGGKAGKRFGATMQNAGYQVQDFAVQVAGGQGALRALTQQAPQFLGAFGPGGAIAGAVLAVGALGLSFRNAAKEAKESAGAVATFRDELDGLSKSRQDKFFDRASVEEGIRGYNQLISNAERIRERHAEDHRKFIALGTIADDGVDFRSAFRGKEYRDQAEKSLSKQLNQESQLIELREKRDELEKKLAESRVNEADRIQKMVDKIKDQDEQAANKMLKQAQSVKATLGGSIGSPLSALLAQGRAVENSVRTPAEVYADELKRLNGLADAGAISQETLSRAVNKAAEALEKAQKAAMRYGTAIDGPASNNRPRQRGGIAFNDPAYDRIAKINEGVAARHSAFDRAIASRHAGPVVPLSPALPEPGAPKAPTATTPERHENRDLVREIRALVTTLEGLPERVGVA